MLHRDKNPMYCGRVACRSRFILGDSDSFHSMFDPNNSRKDVRSEKLGREEIEKVGRFGSSMRNLGKNSTSR